MTGWVTHLLGLAGRWWFYAVFVVLFVTIVWWEVRFRAQGGKHP